MAFDPNMTLFFVVVHIQDDLAAGYDGIALFAEAKPRSYSNRWLGGGLA